MEFKATEIAQVCKHQWKIELFFKWIKQNLETKTFWGTSENAVKVQIWIATSVHVLLVIAKKRLKLKQSPYEILKVLIISGFNKTPIGQIFANQIQ